jgi:hypothetical protein
MPAKRRKQLRLVKVMIQPIFVIDDGKTLEEQTSEPIVVTSGDWENYPEQLAAQMSELEDRLNQSG